MDNTATVRAWNRAYRVPLRIKWVAGCLLLAACFAAGLCAPALALADTTLTVELKGVTPSSADNWLSLPLTAHFDVQSGGKALGTVTANPTAAQLAGGESDTITIGDESVTQVQLYPVAQDGFGARRQLGF